MNDAASRAPAPPPPRSLAALLRPRAVAVVGASREPGSIGYAVVRNLVDRGFTGPVYPVNPKARAVRGVPCHPSLEDVPGPVDLVVVVVPAPAVLAVIEACGRKGVGAAVIISAGFKESGPEGAAREEAVRAAAARHGVRLVGPNCMGVLSTDPEVSLDASFSAVAPAPGNVAFASQSGALGEAILARSRALDLGLSAFVSLGNKADVGADDLLAWWGDDPRTRVVLLYLESLGDPRRFAAAARRVARAGKPILVVKSGRTSAGARASASHTGALAGVDEATSVLLEQAGVLRVTRVEGLFNLARAFSHQPLPRGPRVAIVTNAGGPGIMAADAAATYGLEIAPFSPTTLAVLRALLPPAASVQNPVDTMATASAATFGAALAAALADDGVDALLPIYVGPSVMDVRAVATEIVDAIGRAARAGGSGKPVLACFMGGRVEEAREVMARAGIPAYDFPEDAAQALGAMARFRAWLARDRADPGPPAVDDAWRARVAAAAADLPAGWVGAGAALGLLEAAGLHVAPHAVVDGGADGPDRLAGAARGLGGWPVVAKLDHPDLVHKSDVGGVRLGLEDPAAVRAAGEELLASSQRAGLDPGRVRLLVMRQVEQGRELILGARVDAAVGPVVLAGLGGVHAEVLRDVALRVPPLTDRDADDMLSGLRGYPLLAGHRGEPGVDLPAVRDAVVRLAALAEALPRLLELDVNPLMALTPGHGAVVVDARLRLRPALEDARSA
jgi:acetyl coenzyme A synthetase (ADP forming)-like protein